MHIYSQRDLVVNNKELNYFGIFRVDELISVINNALRDKNYTPREKKSEEIVTETGRRTYMEIRPYKELTDYAKLMLNIKITLNNVSETIEKVDNVNRKFQKGDVHIAFDSWIIADYEHRMRMRPWIFYFKGIFNKYIYNFSTEKNFAGELVSDTAHVFVMVRKLLNSYKVESGKHKTEEEVRAEIEKDIGS